MEISLSELVELVDGELIRAGVGKSFSGFASLKEARSDEISFFGNEKYLRDLSETSAGAVFVSREEVDAPEGTAQIRVDNPIAAFDAVIRRYGVPKPPFRPGIHPGAVVADGVEVNPVKVSIGANAVVEPGAVIGNGTRIGPCSVIGEGAVVGENCDIRGNVSVGYGCVIGDRVTLHNGTAIGADGYGFELIDGRHQKIEQLGIVRIGDDVEIGANSCVDRARFGETVIGEGTKIDNLVQIGHNCVIGKHCLIVAQTGISGSVRVGNYVTFAAKSGIAGHLEIGDRAVVGGDANVISSVPPGETVFGYPARPMKEELRSRMHLKKLPGLIERVKKLEAGEGA